MEGRQQTPCANNDPSEDPDEYWMTAQATLNLEQSDPVKDYLKDHFPLHNKNNNIQITINYQTCIMLYFCKTNQLQRKSFLY